MNATQKIILRMKAAFSMAQQSRGRARAETKINAERARSEVALIIDEMAEEGVDVNSPLGQSVLAAICAERLKKINPPSGFTAEFSLEDD